MRDGFEPASVVRVDLSHNPFRRNVSVAVRCHFAGCVAVMEAADGDQVACVQEKGWVHFRGDEVMGNLTWIPTLEAVALNPLADWIHVLEYP